jgi:hypothetical protein
MMQMWGLKGAIYHLHIIFWKGIFSSAPNISFTNALGYPLMIMPFLGLKLPLICISLMNAILYYLSVVLYIRPFLISK